MNDQPATKGDLDRVVDLIQQLVQQLSGRIDPRFEAVDRRFEAVENRLDRVGDTIVGLQTQMAA